MTARRREVASGHDQEFGRAAIPFAKLISCRCDFQLLIAGGAAFQTVDVICRITVSVHRKCFQAEIDRVAEIGIFDNEV